MKPQELDLFKKVVRNHMNSFIQDRENYIPCLPDSFTERMKDMFDWEMDRFVYQLDKQ